MKRIVITTESGTDLPAERAQALDIRIIPMWVVTEGRSRQDGSFPAGEVFTYYKKTKTVPSTSAVNPQEYMEFFKELRREKPDADILHIAYTSKASSTWQNASIAIKELNDPGIFLADSLNVSGGISLICEKAAQIAGRAADGKAALEELESWIRRARVTFLPDSLEFLKAGGRVSNAAYLGASLLQLKPQILIQDGLLVASRKYRGKMDAVAVPYLEDFVRNNSLDREDLYLFYTDGFSMNLLELLEKRAGELGFCNVRRAMCGCVISCHGGPGALGIAGFAQEGH